MQLGPSVLETQASDDTSSFSMHILVQLASMMTRSLHALVLNVIHTFCVEKLTFPKKGAHGWVLLLFADPSSKRVDKGL